MVSATPVKSVLPWDNRNVLPKCQHAGANTKMAQGAGLHLQLAAEYGNVSIIHAVLLVRH